MGFKFYGIGAAQNRDRKGELIVIDGLDVNDLRYICDEHEDGSRNILGAITYYKKIHNEKEAVTPREKRCWDECKAPFLYLEGELADGEGHPDAVAAAALIKFANSRPDLPLNVGLSIEGGIFKRDDTDKRTIQKSLGEGVALTIRPCNPACKLFAFNDLKKSDIDNLQLPVTYVQKLIEQVKLNRSSINENVHHKLKEVTEKLKKSLEDYKQGTQAQLKCWGCGETQVLFKSSHKWPNSCPHCGKKHSMTEIWDALNQ